MKNAMAEARRKQPFEPFGLRMVGGMVEQVPHPESVYTTPGRSRSCVWTNREGVPVFLNEMLVESVRPAENGRVRRRKMHPGGHR
jgi:hypothetical protein